MFRVLGKPLLAQVSRPAARASPICRALSSTPRRLSDHAPPTLFGPGSPAGAVPTDEAQATGLDRLQMLGKMEGIDVFDQRGLEMTREGTMADPIVIPAYGKSRIVGCTGFPAESHEVLWMTIPIHKVGRCKECGNVYKIQFLGDEHDDDHHH